jgi:hypothetical protein
MDFASLDRDTRTLALVGFFLQNWALLEFRINQAIGKALGLNDVQTVIVARNVQFRDKIHILNTAIWHNEKSAMTPAKREEYQKTLNAIQAYSPVRNMMAHDLFDNSEETDGVLFQVIQARGRVKFPDEDWSIEKFIAEFRKLSSWRREVNALIKELTPMTLNEAIAGSLLTSSGAPTVELSELGALGQALRQAPETPGSSQTQTTPETDGEMPLDAPGKAEGENPE